MGSRPPRSSHHVRPLYLADDEFSASREPHFFRGVTVGLAAQVVFARSWSCSDGVEPCSTLTSALNVGATPTLDLLAELGGRRLRFVLGAYSSPLPMGLGDVGTGILGGQQPPLVTPWRDRRGHRHGVALAVGVWLGQLSVTLGYRFAPAAWIHTGERRAAKRRPAASDAGARSPDRTPRPSATAATAAC